jgi:DNA repair exonuclease SbcCD ATPase subunit
MSNETRKKALAKYLQCEISELKTSEYDPNLLIHNEHFTKYGTGPIEAKENIELVIKALSIAFPGLNLARVNHGTFCADYLVAQRLKGAMKQLTIHFENLSKEKKRIQETLPKFYCYSPKLKMPITKKQLHLVNWDNMRLSVLSTKFDEIEKAEKQIENIEMEIKKINEENVNLLSYNNMVTQIRNNKESNALTKIGIHDLVNTLYYLCPDSDENTRYDSKQTAEYKKMLRDIFDGKPVEDYRDQTLANDGEYLVLTDKEADEKAKEDILNSLWAFIPDFLQKYYPDGCNADAIGKMQETECESANETVKALIIAGKYSLDDFVIDAICADGRAHFMNTYDGTEKASGNYFIFRTN